jgi:hypothetical protein
MGTHLWVWPLEAGFHRKTSGILEHFLMKKFVFTFAALISLGSFVSLAQAESAPCEDMLKTLNDTITTVKLSDADMKKVTDLKAKAEERCTAEDDKRSDGFVADAMKIMGK